MIPLAQRRWHRKRREARYKRKLEDVFANIHLPFITAAEQRQRLWLLSHGYSTESYETAFERALGLFTVLDRALLDQHEKTIQWKRMEKLI